MLSTGNDGCLGSGCCSMPAVKLAISQGVHAEPCRPYERERWPVLRTGVAAAADMVPGLVNCCLKVKGTCPNKGMH